MTTPLLHFPILEGHEVAVTEWGAGRAATVILWHGLARSGADFRDLAEALAPHYRVLAVDQIGRGLSQWARDPAKDYCFESYGRIAIALCEHFDIGRMRWIGTSMGGALGMRLAGGIMRERITHLVINDIGPEIPAPALERILTYVGNPPVWDTMAELEDWLRKAYVPYGHLSEAQWRHMARTSFRRRDDGRITVHYDPNIVQQFTQHPRDYDQWEDYERIGARTLLLRGAESDLLLPDVALRMTETGPRATLIVVPGCGHAPALNVPDQIGRVKAFLAS
jgi:pimeloyl-ACP methyl ester carboxylesterase